MLGLITHQLVNGLEPKTSPYEVRDTELKGFLIRVQPTNTKTYYAEYGRGKRLKISPAGVMTPREARNEAKRIIGTAYRGLDPKIELEGPQDCNEKLTLSTFLNEIYEPWAVQNIRTHRKTIERINFNFDHFLDTPLCEIDSRGIESWRTKRLQSGSKPSTINRATDDLKSILNKAVTWDYLSTTLLDGLKRLRNDSDPIVRYLLAEEKEKLFLALKARDARLKTERETANRLRQERNDKPYPDLTGFSFGDHLTPMVTISLYTGIRQGELFSLTWEGLDLEKNLLTIRGENSKNGKTRHISLNTEVIKILKEWSDLKGRSTRLIFPSKGGKPFDNVNTAWSNVLDAAEIENFRWHDMRHTFASWLVMKGNDLNTVRELLGHSGIDMTLRYAHLAPEHKAAAVASLLG